MTPLVSTAWLAEHLYDDDLRIVDIRGHVLPASQPPPHYFNHRDEYDEAHIPNAVFIDWTTDIVEPQSPTYDVAEPQRYAELMASLGIGDTHRVVAYDDANGMFAARLWWTMTYYGHDQVAVLDGGWQKWVAEGHPTTCDVPQHPSAVFTARPQAQHRATAATILDTSPPLLDVRSPAEFAGQASRATRKGRIPQAINVPRKQLLTADGMLKPADDLRRLFTDAGIVLDDPATVVYCNSGVSASYGLLALRVAGLDGGRVYDGSWKDWGNDDSKPIA